MDIHPGDEEWLIAKKEYNEKTLGNISSLRHPRDYHPTSDDSAGSCKSIRSQKMKRQSPQDRYISNMAREIKYLTADLSELKTQQSEMLR